MQKGESYVAYVGVTSNEQCKWACKHDLHFVSPTHGDYVMATCTSAFLYDDPEEAEMAGFAVVDYFKQNGRFPNLGERWI